MRSFEEVTDHILRLELRLRIFGPIQAPVAVWLIRTAEGWTLIDTGAPETADQLISAVVRATGGDAVFNLGGRLGPPLSLATPDPEQARASMRRLGELEYEHLLPSHGPPILHHGKATMHRMLQRRGLLGGNSPDS